MVDTAGSAIVGGLSDIDIDFTNDAREYVVLMLQEKREWAALVAYQAVHGDTLAIYESDAAYRALVDAWEAVDDARRALSKKMVAEYGDLV
jgi:hypothetical protein